MHSNSKDDEKTINANQLIRSNSFLSNHKAYSLQGEMDDFSSILNNSPDHASNTPQASAYGAQKASLSAEPSPKPNSMYFLSKPSSIVPQAGSAAKVASMPFAGQTCSFSAAPSNFQTGAEANAAGAGGMPSRLLPPQSQAFAPPAFYPGHAVRSPFVFSQQQKISNPLGSSLPYNPPQNTAQPSPTNAAQSDASTSSPNLIGVMPAGLREYRLTALLSQWQEKPLSVVNNNLIQALPHIASQIINGTIQNTGIFTGSVVKVLAIYGISLKKLPEIRGSPIDLFIFYSVVTSLGGYRKVTADRKWAIVANALGYVFATCGMSIAEYENFLLILRCLYSKILYFYEQIFFLRVSPTNVLESVVPPGITGPFAPASEAASGPSPASFASHASPIPSAGSFGQMRSQAHAPTSQNAESSAAVFKKDPQPGTASQQKSREFSEKITKPVLNNSEPVDIPPVSIPLPPTQPSQSASAKPVNRQSSSSQNPQNISLFLRGEFDFIKREFLSIQIINATIPYRHQPVSDFGKINSKKLKMSLSSGITCEVSYAINALNSLALNGASSGLSFRSLPWLLAIFAAILSAETSSIESDLLEKTNDSLKNIWINNFLMQDYNVHSIFCSFAKNLQFSVMIALRNILFYSGNLSSEIEALAGSPLLLLCLLKWCCLYQGSSRSSPDYILNLNAMEILGLISRHFDLSDLLKSNPDLSLQMDSFGVNLVKIFDEHCLPLFTNSAIDSSELKQPRYDLLKGIVLRDFRILISTISHNYHILNQFKVGLNFLSHFNKKLQVDILNIVLQRIFFPIINGPLETFLYSFVAFIKFLFNPSHNHPFKKDDTLLIGSFWLENVVFSRFLSFYDFGMIENVLEALILQIETFFQNFLLEDYLQSPLHIDYDSVCRVYLSILQLLPFYSEKVQKNHLHPPSTSTQEKQTKSPGSVPLLTFEAHIAAHIKVGAWNTHSSLLQTGLLMGRLLLLASHKQIAECLDAVQKIQKSLFECLIFIKPSHCIPPQDSNSCLIEDFVTLTSELLTIGA